MVLEKIMTEENKETTIEEIKYPPKTLGIDQPSCLSYRQHLFCQNYVALNGNAVEAYKKAGFNGQDKHSILSNAYKLLGMPAVKEQIARISNQKALEVSATHDWMVAKLRYMIDKLETIDIDKLSFKDCLKAMDMIIEVKGMGSSARAISEFVTAKETRRAIDAIIGELSK